MSIITALVSRKGGVVGSDGRMFSSAVFDSNNELITPAKIERDDFNKTFMFDSRIIGAFCGLLSFNKLTISEHIDEILSNGLKPDYAFEEAVDILNKEISKKLKSISTDEVLFRFRSVDLLLVSRLSKKAMGIAKLRFSPSDSNIIRANKEIIIVNNNNQYCLFGDDNAQQGAVKAFASNKAPNRDIKFLNNLVIKALKTGIESAGKHPYSGELSCGGEIFRRQIK